jgi:chemotaxis-related protein WspD
MNIPDRDQAAHAPVQDGGGNSAGVRSITDCWNRTGVRGNRTCPELAAHVHCRNCPVYTGAAVQLLDRDLAAADIEQAARLLARPRVAERYGTRSTTVFRLGAEWLAVPTLLVQEVVEARTAHSLPHRSGHVLRGLVNVRGELLACVALDRMLGIDAATPAVRRDQRDQRALARARLVVLKRGPERFAFPAAEVHGALRYHPDDLRPVPSTLALATAKYTHAVLPWDNGSIGILDEELLFHTLNRSME